MFVSVFVNSNRVTSVARAASLTVDDVLRVETNRGLGVQAIEDVESISDGGGGTLSPARATVLRDVLVLVP